MSTKTKKTTAVAVTSTSQELAVQIDSLMDKIPQLVAEQKAYLSKLQGDDEDSTVSLDIDYHGETIKSVEKVSTLVEMEASVIAREAAYTANLKARNLEDKVVAWSLSDKGIAHWKKVFDKAFNTLVNKAEINVVKERITELEKHLSEDAKKKATLEKLLAAGHAKLA